MMKVSGLKTPPAVSAVRIVVLAAGKKNTIKGHAPIAARFCNREKNMDGISLYDELIRQAPGLAALVLVVVVFLKAMAARDSLFLQAQKDRDTLFLASQEMRDKSWLASIGALTTQVGANSEIIIAHNAAMEVTAATLIREKKKSLKQ